jgi:3-hydroxymyristoyl/3-hydroxydecanoyl-(acyl carrier protein) dehydratase
MTPPRLRAELLREQRSPGRLVQELRVPRELACWPGHFPGAELVPGVVQLHWVLEALGEWTQAPARLAEIAGLKFRSILLPGQELSLELVCESAGKHVDFQLFRGEVIYASGRLVLAEGAP